MANLAAPFVLLLASGVKEVASILASSPIPHNLSSDSSNNVGSAGAEALPLSYESASSPSPYSPVLGSSDRNFSDLEETVNFYDAWEQGDPFADASSSMYESRNGSFWHNGRLLSSPSSSTPETCDVEWADGEEETYEKLRSRCGKKKIKCFIKDKKQCMPCSLSGPQAFVSLLIFAVCGYTGLTFYNTILEMAETGKKGYSTVVKYVEVLLKFVQVVGVGSVSVMRFVILMAML